MKGTRPVRVAIIDDYDVIVEGTAAMLRDHRDLVDVVACETDGSLNSPVHVALLDCFAQAEAHSSIVEMVAGNPLVGRLAVYTWNFTPELIDIAFGRGADAYLSKGMPAAELARSLASVADGDRVVSAADGARRRPLEGRNWPGVEEGLTERESEILALITQGRRRVEVAEELYLSINSVKTHTRSLYRKIGVSNRTDAVLWGIDHGFRPNRSSREVWSAQADPGQAPEAVP